MQDNYAFIMSDLAVISKTIHVPAERHGTIVDSGASSHFCPDKGKFLNFVKITPQEVYTASGDVISATGWGDVKIDLPLGSKQMTVTLKDALYAPSMAFTLISTNRIASTGFAVVFEGKMCRILSATPGRRTIAEIPQVQGLYSVASKRKHRANVAMMKLTINNLHRSLGHVLHAALLDAVKNGLVEGINLDTVPAAEFCEACIKAKSAHKPFPEETKNCALTYEELVHTDLWGPAQTPSISGSLYYISFTDDYSRKTKLTFLKHKSEALEALKQYEAWLIRQNPGVRL